MTTKRPAGRPRGRPPLGDRAMTDLERQRRHHDLRYWRLPAGITRGDFEAWLEAHGYRQWLRSKGVEAND
jgi:hypothetical protein